MLGRGVGGLDHMSLLPDYVTPLITKGSPFYQLWPLDDIPVLFR